MAGSIMRDVVTPTNIIVTVILVLALSALPLVYIYQVWCGFIPDAPIGTLNNKIF